MVDLNELNLPRGNEWYYENGYLTIDLELFGKYLSILFTEFLGEYHRFQIFNPKLQTTRDIPIWDQGREERKMAIISPIQHSSFRKNYNETRITYFRSSGQNIYAMDYKTLFAKDPLELNEKDFLIYFNTYSSKVNLTLGYVENKKFICNDFFNIGTKEVKHSNPEYSFVTDFVNAIFYYKIVNIKPDLDENDMELILRYFGINREDKLNRLLEILRNLNQNAIDILLSSNNVGDTSKMLKRKKGQ